MDQIRKVLNEATKIGTINWIYFEGGEPFLFYPIMIEGIKIARSMGFKVGVVTNAYYATSEVRSYNADSHPICGPLVRGGPALLAKEYNVEHEDKCVDACHFCYLICLALIDRFPQYLAPKQVYGSE